MTNPFPQSIRILVEASGTMDAEWWMGQSRPSAADPSPRQENRQIVLKYAVTVFLGDGEEAVEVFGPSSN
jgi:hypothetical protein